MREANVRLLSPRAHDVTLKCCSTWKVVTVIKGLVARTESFCDGFVTWTRPDPWTQARNPCEGLSKSLGRRTYRSESPKSQFQSHEIVTHRASRNFPISFSFASFLNVFATFYHLLDGCARVWWLRLSIDCWCCRFGFITSEKRKIFAINYSMMKCFLSWGWFNELLI